MRSVSISNSFKFRSFLSKIRHFHCFCLLCICQEQTMHWPKKTNSSNIIEEHFIFTQVYETHMHVRNSQRRNRGTYRIFFSIFQVRMIWWIISILFQEQTPRRNNTWSLRAFKLPVSPLHTIITIRKRSYARRIPTKEENCLGLH